MGRALNSVDLHDVARPEGHRDTRRGDPRGAAVDDDARASLQVDVDPVLPGAFERHRGVRGVDPEGLARLEVPHEEPGGPTPDVEPLHVVRELDRLEA